MRLKPVTWKAGRYNVRYGFIGRFQVAAVSWDQGGYKARLEFLGDDVKAGFQDIQAAMAWAEAQLDRLVRELLR